MKEVNFIHGTRISRLVFLIVIVLSGCVSVSDQIEITHGYSENFTSIKNQFQYLDWKKEANAMVNQQIIARGITDKRVIEVMKNTPRHQFVPSKYRTEAYDDGPLPIGEGQTISQPYIVALMTELLQIKGGEKVLEIGTGSGYQAAVLSRLVKNVYTIEIIQSLADTSKSKLMQLGYKNIVFKWGDGYKGWKEYAPFDRIIVTAAPDKIPEELVNQLKVGGIMVVPVGEKYQNLIVVTKTEKGIIEEKNIAVRFVPMVKP